MVYTRSKKRGLEDLEVQENEEQITSSIRKKKKQSDNGSGNDNKDDDKDNGEEEDTFVTETDTEDEEEWKEDANSEAEDADDESGSTDELKGQILTLFAKKLEKALVKEEDQDKPAKDEYGRLKKHLESIYNGSFFERVPIEDKIKMLKEKVSEDELRVINEQLQTLKSMYRDSAPSILDIIKQDVPDGQKQKMLEKVYHLTNAEILSSEYNNNLKYLKSTLDSNYDDDMKKLYLEIQEYGKNFEMSDDYKEKILKSKMSFHNKVIAFKKQEAMESYETSDSSEYAKYKNWLDTLLTIPFGQNRELPSKDVEYIQNVRNILDKRLSYLEKPKDQIINIFSQIIRNPDIKLNAIGLCGMRGCGKTSIVQSIAEALGRPYRCISLGGESDASMLTGHNFTYVGSMPGRIIETLRETKCMNPVILIDELDKVSTTHHGKEIVGTLIHLTDTTTNERYNYDKYFAGIEFDISKALLVFTYNDRSKIDRILADRIFTIEIDNYKFKEKIDIVKKHILPNVLKEYNFKPNDIVLGDSVIEYIVEQSKADEGMRDIKRKIEVIISRINTLLLLNDQECIIKLNYKKLHGTFTSLPLQVERSHVDVLLMDSFSTENASGDVPPHMYI
jgi:ATP-dependent Lon protease